MRLCCQRACSRVCLCVFVLTLAPKVQPEAHTPPPAPRTARPICRRVRPRCSILPRQLFIPDLDHRDGTARRNARENSHRNPSRLPNWIDSSMKPTAPSNWKVSCAFFLLGLGRTTFFWRCVRLAHALFGECNHLVRVQGEFTTAGQRRGHSRWVVRGARRGRGGGPGLMLGIGHLRPGIFLHLVFYFPAPHDEIESRANFAAIDV